ncbi:hypothetical protein ACFFX0_03855 [Citricoccus parietis]|uniref:Uncharacterized protein n=1 Tax=Citricoccus parietis TaxID=592307 RepID=A0ABV5FUM6_9MICC
MPVLPPFAESCGQYRSPGPEQSGPGLSCALSQSRGACREPLPIA